MTIIKKGIPTPTTVKTVEILRKYKRGGMTERTCKEAARCVEQWVNEYSRLHLSEFEIEQRAETWVEMFRRLRV